MHLKHLTITNFRKFKDRNNTVDFVAAKMHGNAGDDETSYESIAAATTLLVGKNNAGKTTVTLALAKLVKQSKFGGNDFNLTHLREVLISYIDKGADNSRAVIKPMIAFDVTITVKNDKTVTIGNLLPLLKIEDVAPNKAFIDLSITLRWELSDEPAFNDELAQLTEKYLVQPEDKRKLPLAAFVELLDRCRFELRYYDNENQLLEDSQFSLKQFLAVETIEANRHLHDKALSTVFNKIATYQYQADVNSDERKAIDNKIDSINQDLTAQIGKAHNETVNGVLGEVEANDRMGVQLTADLSFEKMMTSVVKYQYEEKGEYIPEGQFGLGYTNLMHIIGQLIDFVESYPQNDSFSKLNIVAIEEPESFMHPQMQANFIKYIDDAVSFLLKQHTDKHINVQLIITTHSSHILNSKIHSANSFDNINYINDINRQSQVVRLSDEAIMPQTTERNASEKARDDLSYLKKHIKYKVSELFFCDAIILVEGATEETLLPFFKEKNEALNKKYIPIFNIGGAHGMVYHRLLRLLGVPTLIITDIDVDRDDEEKEAFGQLESLTNRGSTNATIKHYAEQAATNLAEVDYIEQDNLHIVFQKDSVNGYYATSLEEAMILQNYENGLFNSALKAVKPKIYDEIVGEDKDTDQLCHQSFKLQKKLSGSKGNFANELLYQLTTQDIAAHPALPDYLQHGFTWLATQLNSNIAEVQA